LSKDIIILTGFASIVSTILETINPSRIPFPDLLEDQPVFRIADKNAEFQGGQIALLSFLAKHLHLKSDGMVFQSSFYVTFIVDTIGNIRNACI